MRKFLFLLPLLLFAKCWGVTHYALTPQGEFVYSGYFNILMLDDVICKEFEIFRIPDDFEGLDDFIKVGVVEKLTKSTREYCYKEGDEILSTYFSYFFSNGNSEDSMKEFRIFDSELNLVGKIAGVYTAEEAAEFWFYNEPEQVIAKAFLNECHSYLQIIDDEENTAYECIKIFPLENLFYSSKNSPTYFWMIRDFEIDSPLENQFLWPFIAFISEAWWNRNLEAEIKKFKELSDDE